MIEHARIDPTNAIRHFYDTHPINFNQILASLQEHGYAGPSICRGFEHRVGDGAFGTTRDLP